MGRYFGTDGFRGRAGTTLTAEHAFKIGRYLGNSFGKILIARDTRHSGDMFENALAAGITAQGGDVYLLGVSTTPSVSFIVKKCKLDCGIMISASHNPYYDNGIKIINGSGAKLGDSEIAAIEDYMDGLGEELQFKSGHEIGTVRNFNNAVDMYISYLNSIALVDSSETEYDLDYDVDQDPEYRWAEKATEIVELHTGRDESPHAVDGGEAVAEKKASEGVSPYAGYGGPDGTAADGLDGTDGSDGDSEADGAEGAIEAGAAPGADDDDFFDYSYEEDERLEEILALAERYFAEARGEVCGIGNGSLHLVSDDEEPGDEESGDIDSDDDNAEQEDGECANPFMGRRIAIDCANGSASEIADEIYSRLGADTCIMANYPDGFNINECVGSTHIEAIGKFVRDSGCEIGFAYDGDADRCLAVDQFGNPVNGDQLMFACAKYLKENGRLKDDTLVVTVMSNLGLLRALEREGMRYETTAVGDRYVWECMDAHGYTLGGEQSGHIIFSKYASTGDGILTSLMVLLALGDRGADTLISDCPMYPQALKNVRAADKEAAMRAPAVQEAVREAEARLSGSGRVLVRPSGTEPMVRVMVEAPDERTCDELCGLIARAIETL